MADYRQASRWLAALVLTQMVVGPIANFKMLDSSLHGAGGFLVNAAPHATALATAALLTLALSLTLAVTAIVLWPILKPLSERMALTLAMLGAAGIALSGVENAGLMSMLSLSQAHQATAAPDAALFEGLRGVVAWHRNWSHLLQLLAAGGLILAMYAAFFRFRLLPRWLAGFGMLASALQMVAVTKPLYGGWVLFPLLLPLGIAQLLLIAWLLAKGLQPRREG
jgi:hypothetical protein